MVFEFRSILKKNTNIQFESGITEAGSRALKCIRNLHTVLVLLSNKFLSLTSSKSHKVLSLLLLYFLYIKSFIVLCVLLLFQRFSIYRKFIVADIHINLKDFIRLSWILFCFRTVFQFIFVAITVALLISSTHLSLTFMLYIKFNVNPIQ